MLLIVWRHRQTVTVKSESWKRSNLVFVTKLLVLITIHFNQMDRKAFLVGHLCGVFPNWFQLLTPMTPGSVEFDKGIRMVL
jgi:hypothetical protein